MNKKAHLAGIGFSIIFGFSFMFSKKLMAYISPMGVISYRFLIAFLAFEILRRSKVIHINLRNKSNWPIIIVGVFQPILYFIFETYGLEKTTSAEAGLMIALIPIFVTIFSAIILKEKPRILQILFILVSFLGVVVIQISNPNDGFEINYIGFILLLSAVISAALFNIASRSASRTHKAIETTYLMSFMGMISFNLIYLIQLSIEGNTMSYITVLSNLNVIGPILYLGLIASIFGFLLVNYSLSQLPAHVTSIYANISTIVSVIVGFLFLSEIITLYHLIGGVLIIIGVYGTTRVNYLINKRKII